MYVHNKQNEKLKKQKTLQEAGICLKNECRLAQKQIECFGLELSPTGFKPVEKKIQGITDNLWSKSLKDLRSFIGAVNHKNKFIPDLATKCAPLRPLLKQETNWDWKPKHGKAFKENQEAIQAIQQITELRHFKRMLLLGIICDANKEGSGAVSQQKAETK